MRNVIRGLTRGTGCLTNSSNGSLSSEESSVKAKMPSSQKPPEQGDYECLLCRNIFSFAPDQSAELKCPKCDNGDRKDLVPIYMENYAPEEKMYTAADWHGGA